MSSIEKFERLITPMGTAARIGAVASLLLVAAACGGTQGVEGSATTGDEQAALRADIGLFPEQARKEVAPLVSKTWAGHDLGISPGKWKLIGEMKLAGPNEEFKRPTLDESLPSAPDLHPNSVVIGDPATKKMYSVDLDAKELSELGKVLQAAGYANPTVKDGEAANLGTDSSTVKKGWSNGVDNRNDLGDGSQAQDAWPYRTIGQLKNDGQSSTTNGFCTATFVASAGDADTRYIITASHCMWSTSTGAYQDPDFYPRQDRCLNNTGGAVAGCSQAPYGVWDGGQWMMMQYFIDNCAGQPTLTAECVANDITVMRVHRQSGGSFPGAQGLAYWGKTDLDGVLKYHRGYPNCGGAGDPVPAAPKVCLPRTLYGDGAFSIGSGLSVDGDGWPRRYKYSTDISPGHSGGPSYFSSGGNHYVFGTASTQDCSGSSCTGTQVNTMRAMNAFFFNASLSFMGL
jgi:V8-like Glu-specific endopeptidase